MTEKQEISLESKCQRALVELAQVCIRGVVTLHEGDAKAWGQFLEAGGDFPSEELKGQFGIYGTCAALEILALAGQVEDNQDLIQKALGSLPVISDDCHHTVREYYTNKGDVSTTYKLAALIDVTQVVYGDGWPEVSRTAPIEAIIGLSRQSGGWPDYKHNDDVLEANVSATIVALLALSRCTALNPAQQTSIAQGLRFIKLYSFSELSIANISMLVIALERFRAKSATFNVIANHAAFRTLLGQSREQLSRWAVRSRAEDARRSLEGFDYRSPQTKDQTGAKRFQFLLYIPHCLAAIAILESPHLQKRYSNRMFVRQVIAIYAGDIVDHNDLIPGARGRVSSVESMWLARLFAAYITSDIEGHPVRDLLDRLRSPKRAAVTALVVLLGLTLPVAAVYFDGKAAIILATIGSVLLSVSTAILTGLLVERQNRIW
jgi:hypothetical protein